MLVTCPSILHASTESLVQTLFATTVVCAADVSVTALDAEMGAKSAVVTATAIASGVEGEGCPLGGGWVWQAARSAQLGPLDAAAHLLFG